MKGHQMIDNYKASELTDKLSAVFGNVKEEKVSISKYNESTQTYYADEALAKQHVRQISKEERMDLSDNDCRRERRLNASGNQITNLSCTGIK